MKRAALISDLDYTAINGYHPSAIWHSLGREVPEYFWERIGAEQIDLNTQGYLEDKTVIYISNLIDEILHGDLARDNIQRSSLQHAGKFITPMCYPGMPHFFTDVRKGLPTVEAHIVSSGVKDIIEGSCFAEHIDTIHSYMLRTSHYPPHSLTRIVGTVSMGEKGGLGRRISKGNASNEGEYEIPFSQCIFLCDGHTDRRLCRDVKDYGGVNVGVINPYNPLESEKKVQSDIGDLADVILLGDYNPGTDIWNFVREHLEKIVNEN